MSDGLVLAEGSLIHNEYRVVGLIGGGAMSRVYKVEHIAHGTTHALKQQMDASYHQEERSELMAELALREARLLESLSHPFLPRVTDFFREDDVIYLVMDFIEGHNLKVLLDANTTHGIDIPLALNWGVQICDILTYLHNQKPPIIFRDIKPANIIRRPDNTICLVDFGIAREVRKGAATDTVVFGSPGYAPPEQYGQGQTDPRSDIYALGATLHHLLTGRDPSIAPFKWPSLRSLNPQIPLVLDKLITRCVDMDMSRRPESAQALEKSLRSILQMLEDASALTGTGSLIGLKTPSDSGLLLPSDLAALPVTDRSGTIPLNVAEDMESQRLSRGRNEAHGRNEARGGSSTLAAPRPTSVPRDLTREGEDGRFVPDIPRALTALQKTLYQTLFACALAIMVGSAVLPFAAGLLAPAPPPIAAPAPLPRTATLDERAEYLRVRRQDALTAAQARRAADIYDRLTSARYALALLVCTAFFLGTVRPLRPTRWGMALTIGGILGLICLTGATLLPARGNLFILLAFLESLLLIPAAFLLTEPLP